MRVHNLSHYSIYKQVYTVWPTLLNCHVRNRCFMCFVGELLTLCVYVIYVCEHSMNRLSTLPRGFGSLPALEVLDLTYNNLNQNSLPGNFFYLSKCRSLTRAHTGHTYPFSHTTGRPQPQPKPDSYHNVKTTS